MAFKIGNKKGLGRKPGSTNKSTTEVRKAFQDLVESNLEQLAKDLADLEPKDRIKSILELSRFILPTLKAVDIQTDTNDIFEPVIIHFTNRNENTTQ
jgi:hypothetical protein